MFQRMFKAPDGVVLILGKYLDIYNFKKFVHIKSSLHWTLGHVAQLIALNEGYTLAGVSENSFENWIKA